jgi:hypothetical protein
MGGGGSPALDFIEVHHLQPVAAAGVDGFTLDGAQRCTQRQATHAPHAIDADSHALNSFIISRFIEI